MSRSAWEPSGTRATRVIAWNEAADDLMSYYQVYGTRNAQEAASSVKALSRYFRGWELATIDAPSIMEYAARRREVGDAAATINLCLATLRRALRLAHEHGKLEKVPVIRMLRPAPPRSGFFEREQLEAVTSALPANLSVVVRLAYAYGWRVNSEILTLTCRQVDFGAGTLRLDPGTTKNREGRLVYLTPALQDDLATQLVRVRCLERELGKIIPFVFPTPYGRFKGQRRKRFIKTWQRACREAGCPGILVHDLRRTAVRDMVNAGISERVAMAITGHKNRSVFDRYHVVAPTDLRDAARKMAQTEPRTKQAQNRRVMIERQAFDFSRNLSRSGR